MNEDGPNVAKAAIIAHEHNLNLFRNFKCRYTFTQGNADTLEKALAGEYRNVSKCEFNLIVSGDKEKFECIAPEAKPPKPDEMEEIEGGLYVAPSIQASFSLLQWGSTRLEKYQRLSPRRSHVTVYDKQYRRTETFPTPLSMGITGPLEMRAPFAILQGMAGNVAITSQGVAKQENQSVIHVGFKSQEWGEEDFYFDPQRGHLPCMVSERLISPPPKGMPYPETRTYLKAAKECNNKGWFPLHFVRIHFPKQPNTTCGIVEIRVSFLDTDTQVTDADLTLELPAGTVIQAPSDRYWQFFSLRQNEKVTPGDIPKLQEMLKKVDQRNNAWTRPSHARTLG
jgi:hypothetical protein